MKIININDKLKGTSVFKWDNEYLFKYLTEGSNPVLSNPRLIAAFRKIDRAEFIPYEHKDKAYEDIDLSIGYDEEITRPSTIGQMLEIMNPKLGGKYLDIGSGSGYFAMLLGFAISNEGKVFSVERIQWLWEACRSNATRFPEVKNVKFLYRDGLAGIPGEAPFDGIHISFALDEVPQELKMQLNQNGAKLVCPGKDNYLRIIERNGEDEFIEELVPGYVFKEGKVGTV